MPVVECFYFEEVMERLEAIHICHSTLPGMESEECDSCPANPLAVTDDEEVLSGSLLE